MQNVAVSWFVGKHNVHCTLAYPGMHNVPVLLVGWDSVIVLNGVQHVAPQAVAEAWLHPQGPPTTHHIHTHSQHSQNTKLKQKQVGLKGSDWREFIVHIEPSATNSSIEDTRT